METLIFIILGFLSALFLVYSLSKEDFVFIRKGISQESLFDLVLLTGILSLFFSRILFSVLNGRYSLLNPIMFLSFPYFPGFSIPGGIAGGVLSFIYLSSKRKFPVKRLFDIFTTSVLFSLSLGYFFQNILEFTLRKTYLLEDIVQFMFFSLLFVIFLRLFVKSKFGEGFLGIIFLLSTSVSFLIRNYFIKDGIFYFYNKENILLILLFISSLFFLIKERKVFFKIRK